MSERSRDDRDVLRWLLRPLGEPAFLRLLLDDEGGGGSFRLFESLFWALAPDAEHAVDVREAAWEEIASVGPGWGASPADWFMGLIGYLRERAERAPGVIEVARFWSLPEIFAPPAHPAPSRAEDEPAYVELHAHFRGSVPYLTLWTGWLMNARWRARLRSLVFNDGRWRKTGAELLAEAARLRTEFAPRIRGDDEARFLYRVATLALRRRHWRRFAAPYLGICTTLRRELLHQRLKTGLAEFDRTYRRYSGIQKIPSVSERQHTRRLVVAVLRRFEMEGAAAVELRPTLEPTRRELGAKLGSLLDGYFEYLREAQRPVRFGLIPSLVKQEALPEVGELGLDHWRRQSAMWCRQVELLLEALRDSPSLRYFIVGVDVAGQERGCPPRGLAAAVQQVRAYNAAHGVAELAPGRAMLAPSILRERGLDALRHDPCNPVRLGITVHLGEDFVDPLTGLRHIAEGVESLGLTAGDRLGHALALALDERRLDAMLRRRAGTEEVRMLSRGRYELHKPRGEHLLDLAWVLRSSDDEATRAVAAAQLSEAAASMFGVPADPERLAAMLAMRPDVMVDVPAARYSGPHRVLARDRVWVSTEARWWKLFDSLRQQLFRSITLRQLVVESCPSSNCAVANLSEPPILALIEQKSLRVAIATDDPAVFSAWPVDELRSLDTHLAATGVRDTERAALRRRLLCENARASFVR